MKKTKLPEFTITEVILIRSALNDTWTRWVKDKCPKAAFKDLNKYHAWCEIAEKDMMTDLYWVQQIRKKLNDYERTLLR